MPRHTIVVVVLVSVIACLSAPAVAAPTTGCSIQGLTVEPFLRNTNRYAWVRGFGNCGSGVAPKFTFALVIRDRLGVRQPAWVGKSKVLIRYYGSGAHVAATFSLDTTTTRTEAFVLP